MAALQKIRSKAGLLIGVLAVALLAFIFPWSELTSFVNRSRDRAFSVDGEVISTGAYLTRVNEFENFQKMVSGQPSLDENTTAQIREYVYEQMVKEIMLNDEAEKLGLGISDEELRDLTVGSNVSPILRQMPFFVDPQTGQFSSQALSQFLSFVNTDVRSIPADQPQQRAQLQELQAVWGTILNLVKYQCLEQKYNALLAGSILLNDVEVKQGSEAATTVSNIAYVIDRYSNIADSSVTVTDKEIEKLYNDRKSNFKNNAELRKITYFSKEILPSQSDFDLVEKEIKEAREKLISAENPALVVADYSDVPYQDLYLSKKALYPEITSFVENASVGETYGPTRNSDAFRVYKLVDRTLAPDSVKLRMIILPEGTDAVIANNRADSIINVIKGGKDFAQVANEVYPQSNGGDMGWVTEPQLASAGKEFVDAAFKAPKGEITKLNLQGQIQIVMPEDKTQPVSKYKIALIEMPVVVSDQTLASIDNEINEFVANNSDGKNFVTAANEKGYNLVQDNLVSGSNPGVGQIPGSRQVITWAFNEKPGSIKKFDLSDYKIVAMIDSKVDAGYLPMSEVSDGLKAELIRDKKAELMITDLKAQNLTTLDAYANSIGSKVDTAKFVTFDTPNIMGLGREYVLNVYAEVGQPNKIDGPIKGDNGVLILDVLDKTNQASNFNLGVFKQTFNSRNMYRVMSSSMEALKEKMDVQDNRVKFF